MSINKTIKNIFLLFLLIFIKISGFSQASTVTIGNMSTSNISEKYPFDNYYNYSWANTIYLSSDVGRSGQITKVAFYVYQGTNITMGSQKILMRETTASSYTSTTYPGETGFTTVFNGTITYNFSGSSGWQTITLTTPFNYSGTNNLEFLFENNSGAYTNNFEYFYVTSTSTNRTRRDFNDASYPSSCANCATSAYIPNIQLTMGCAATMTLSPSSPSLCLGNSTVLTASGVSSYTWSPATGLNTTTSASVTANPTVTTTYSVTGKDANNCTQTNTITLTVNPVPVLTITPTSATICAGSGTSLTASGANTYTWSPATGLSATTGTTITASPTVTTTYTLTGTSTTNCTSSKTITITVNPAPSITVTPTSTTICTGNNTTLTASGASSYVWSPATGLSSSTGTTVTASPTVTTTYTLTGTGTGSCTSSKTLTVTVNSLPTLTISPAAPSICAGTSTTLTASGASTYTWSPATGLNATTGASVTANPTVTTTYTITGTNANSCINKTTVSLTVNPVNSLTVTPASATICTGSSTALSVSGASSYTWSPATGLNTTTSSSVTANPTSTTTYTVTGNCNQTKTITLTVNALPTLTITPTATAICAGNTTTLTASGATTYTWSPGTGLSSNTGSSVTANPSTTTTYTLTGTNANNCSNTQTVVVTVNALPTISVNPASASVCAGGSTTLTASGASTYSWLPVSGLNTATGSSVIASPTVTTTYTISGTNSNGCVNSSTALVTINALPSLTVTPNNPTICNGASTSLTASGGSSYTWTPSTGLNTTNGNSVTASPVATTIYTVTGSSSGCLATVSATVNISQVNAGTASALGGTVTCNNAAVSLSLTNANVNQVGTGTNSSEKYPFDGYYNYAWSDVIYLQSDLGSSGTLTQLSFYVNNFPANYVMANQNIFVRTTTATSFTNATYPTTSGFTQVFAGTITYNGSGWKTITLNTPFTYDGVSNLEILYENHNGAWANGFPTFNYTSGYSANRVKRDFVDASFPTSCSNCGAYAYVPNTKFTITRSLGTFVKWQSSIDNINYTDLSGGTTSTFNTIANTSTYYRAQVTNGTCTAPSAPAYYVTNNNYYVNDGSVTGDVFSSAVGASGNDGRSRSAPNNSINYILSNYTLGACDTIFVDNGTYSEEVDIYYPQGGNSSGYTTIHGAGIGKTVLTAPANKNNFYLDQPDYFKIEGFTMNSTQGYSNLFLYEATHNVFANNKINHTAYSNVQVFGDILNGNSNQFLYNTITNSSTNGNAINVEGNCDSTIVQGDTITMSNTASLDAMIFYTYHDNNNVYYPSQTSVTQNVVSGYSYGVSLYGTDYPISTFTISNNNITIKSLTVSDGAPIWLGGVGSSTTDQTLIYNNKLIGGNNGIYFGASVNYEKIYNNYISGSNYGVYVSASSSNSAQLYFNSFYNNTSNVYFVSSANAYWKVKNNILYTTSTATTSANIFVGNATTFSDCNYNLFYAPSGANTARYNSINYPSLSAWQAIAHSAATTHGDESSMGGNPLYNNPSQNNLDLTGLSPADIDGVSISGITTDIYNHVRFNPPNMGAEEEIPVASAGHDTSICIGSSILLHGGSGLVYSWAPAMGLSNTTIANPIASPTITTQYTLTVTDGAESTTSKIKVTVNPIPKIVVTKSSICLGNSATLFASMANSYTWSPSTSLNSSSSASVTATPTTTTIYTVTGSSLGCASTATTSVKVYSNNVTIQISNLDSLFNGDTLSYIVSSTNVSYTVSPGVDQSFCIPLSSNDTGLVPVKITFFGTNTGDTTILFYYLNTSNKPISISTISKNHSSGMIDTLVLDSINYNLRLVGGNTNISFSTSFLNLLFASSQVYATLSRTLDASYFIIQNGALLFNYEEEYADRDKLLTYTLYDTYHNMVSSFKNNTAKIYPVYLGDNRYTMNMSSCDFTNNGPLGSGTYLLIVENEKKEKKYLRIQNNVTSSPNCPQLSGGGTH